MTDIRTLHRADLSDEGGIAPLSEEFDPVPLVDREPDGRVAASWFVIIVAVALILWTVGNWVAGLFQ